MDISAKKKISVKIISWLCIILGILLMVTGVYGYRHNFKNVKNIRVVATAEKSDSALANNARVFHIYTSEDETSEISLNEVNIINGWTYDDKNHLLNAIDLNQKAEFQFQTNNREKPQIEFIKEVGSGIVEIYDENKLISQIDLYENCEWQTFKYPIKVNYFSYYLFNTVCIFVFLLGLYLFIKTVLLKRRKDDVKHIQ